MIDETATPHERDQLLRARELILAKQFDAARALLRALPDSATAHKWLAKLDEISASAPGKPAARPSPIRPLTSAPGQTTAGRAPLPGRSRAQANGSRATNGTGATHIPTPTRRRRRTTNRLLRRGSSRLYVGALLMLTGALIVVGFFAFPWMDAGSKTVTAFNIWIGHDGDHAITLDMENMLMNRKGFVFVRHVDRFLIVLPLGGLALAVMGWAYASEATPAPLALTVILLVALLLTFFPGQWEKMSDDEFQKDRETRQYLYSTYQYGTWEGDYMRSYMRKMLRGYGGDYQTTPHTALGALALTFCAFGCVLELRGSRQRREALAAET
ncbi:MAG: hypothetical protein GYB65_12490 [Chloroflexi bacterium]|nr:hypothetical protein [Chloroflexota bacterium]